MNAHAISSVQMSGTIERGSIFPLDYARDYPVLVRGEGSWVWDERGKRYLDAVAGMGVVTVGHGSRRVAEAVGHQASTLAFCISNIFSNERAAALAAKLGRLTPGDLNHFQFTSGGSEATEVAIKLARQYHLERGRDGKHLVIARWQSYHGATLGALSATGMPGRRRRFEPLLLDFPHIAPNYCYRCPFGESYPSCGMACALDLEQAIRRAGPDRVAAFIAEPVVGAAAGATVPPPEYFPIVREICDRHDVLFIADEVITGVGRTGRNFGIEHWGVVPDLMTMAKGLSGGYAPLGAVAISDRIADVFRSRRVAFDHILTYAANPLAAAAACEVLDIVVEECLVERAARLSEPFFARGRRLLAHPIVGDVRGLGLLMGVELVRDPKTKAPFPPEQKVAALVAGEALRRGLVLYPGTGTADGTAGDHFLICPPLTIEEAHLDLLFELLDESLTAAERQLGAYAERAAT
jgi:adenosylmethionine-8-amino-7-oxononanoate aminotransferase